MKWLQRLFGKGPAGQVNFDNPFVVESPRLAFLNLLGPSGDALVDEDKRALSPLFSSVETSDSEPPSCDVLMIYCKLQNDGAIAGYSAGLRDIIDAAKATVAIVASGNEGSEYVAAGKRGMHSSANLVMTLDRKGPVFVEFFANLFQRMFLGQTMPTAWVDLAPQNPRATHEDCPDTIFIPEISHVAFKG